MGREKVFNEGIRELRKLGFDNFVLVVRVIPDGILSRYIPFDEVVESEGESLKIRKPNGKIESVMPENVLRLEVNRGRRKGENKGQEGPIMTLP
jgi:hypothetical protein